MTKEEKAVRILSERRLTLDVVADPARPGYIEATCRGSDEVYRLGHVEGRGWACTCEANAKFHRVCSHLLALQMVTVKP